MGKIDGASIRRAGGVDSVRESMEEHEESLVQDAVIVHEEMLLEEEATDDAATSLELPDDIPEPSPAYRLWTELAVLRERLRASQMIASERESRIQDLRLVLQMLGSAAATEAHQVVVMPEAEAEAEPAAVAVAPAVPRPSAAAEGGDVAIWRAGAGSWIEGAFTEAPEGGGARLPWMATDQRAAQGWRRPHRSRHGRAGRSRRRWFRLWRR
jgi:hypothetical protein